MSYCRWSDCDVYVYEGEYGWVTHIAGGRNVAGNPPPYDISSDEALKQSLIARDEWYKANDKYEAIDLPLAGESFIDECPGDCAQRLIQLKQIGYDVPQYAIDELLEEQKELDDESS